jgi:hypothetical protein
MKDVHADPHGSDGPNSASNFAGIVIGHTTFWKSPNGPFARTANALAAFMEARDETALCGLADILSGNSPGYLCVLAENGNARAIEQLAHVAIRTTELLERIVERKPAALKAIASQRRNWPLMVSKRKADNKNHTGILAAIGLGGPAPGTKFKESSPFFLHADDLWRAFQRVNGLLDGDHRDWLSSYGKRPKFPVKELLQRWVGNDDWIKTEQEIDLFAKSWVFNQMRLTNEGQWARIFTDLTELRYGSLDKFWAKMHLRLPTNDKRLQGRTQEKFVTVLERRGPPIV